MQTSSEAVRRSERRESEAMVGDGEGGEGTKREVMG